MDKISEFQGPLLASSWVHQWGIPSGDRKERAEWGRGIYSLPPSPQGQCRLALTLHWKPWKMASLHNSPLPRSTCSFLSLSLQKWIVITSLPLIPEDTVLLSSFFLPHTLVLVNSIFFKPSWSYPNHLNEPFIFFVGAWSCHIFRWSLIEIYSFLSKTLLLDSFILLIIFAFYFIKFRSYIS